MIAQTAIKSHEIFPVKNLKRPVYIIKILTDIKVKKHTFFEAKYSVLFI